MAYNDSWLPGRRSAQLVMVKTWNIVLSDKGTLWVIPASDITELGTLSATAEASLLLAEGSDRTPVLTAQCREAFDAMVEKMRFIKTRFFHTPPLLDSDYAALLLKKPNATVSDIPAPEAQPTADVGFPGIHLVELSRIRPVGNASSDQRSDHGARVYWGLTGTPTDRNKFRLSEPPKTGWELPYSLFTRRKKERFDFEGESGNRVYFCLRYETASGKVGPFGPILTAVIP